MILLYGSCRNNKFTTIRYSDAQLRVPGVIEEIKSRGYTIHPMDDPARVIRPPTERELENVIDSIDDLCKELTTDAKGAPNGVATLDDNGRVENDQLPDPVVNYRGTWDPILNKPQLMDGYGESGDRYFVINCEAGIEIDLGSGAFFVKDNDTISYRDGTYGVISSPNLSKRDAELLHNTMQKTVNPEIISPMERVEVSRGVTKTMQIMTRDSINGEFAIVDDGGLTKVSLHSISGELYIDSKDDLQKRHVVKIAHGTSRGQVTDFEIYVDII